METKYPFIEQDFQEWLCSEFSSCHIEVAFTAGAKAALDRINELAPEGYQIAYDSVEERVANLIACAKAFLDELNEVRSERNKPAAEVEDLKFILKEELDYRPDC